MIVFTPNTVIKSADINLNNAEITSTITKRHQLLIKADNTGGAIDSNYLGSPEIKFSGTPTNYGRASGVVPLDYAGGAIKLMVHLWGTSISSNSLNYYVANYGVGDTVATWNIQNNQTYSPINFSANKLKETNFYTISDGVVTAGDYIGFAIRFTSAITGDIYMTGAWLEYTGNYK